MLYLNMLKWVYVFISENNIIIIYSTSSQRKAVQSALQFPNQNYSLKRSTVFTCWPWPWPGSTRTAPSAVHPDGGVKYATCASSKIRHGHTEHKDAKSCRETPGTNTTVEHVHPNVVSGCCSFQQSRNGILRMQNLASDAPFPSSPSLSESFTQPLLKC